jgi:two-component system, LytTR family, response regulator
MIISILKRKDVNDFDIIFFEASINYSIINLIDGSTIKVAKTIKKFENDLPANFFRISRKHIVNLNSVVDMKKIKGRWHIKLSNNKDVEVSRRNMGDFNRHLDFLKLERA